MSKNTAKKYMRELKIPQNYSFFLFGPRGVGKTSLLDEVLPKEKTLKLNLLDNELEYRLSTDKSAFSEILNSLLPNIEWVYIDEIQKIPSLLDEIHNSLESDTLKGTGTPQGTSKKIKFALTGSSARKLKAGQANLLAGRAFTLDLFPLSIIELEDELKNDQKLNEILQFGSLPKVFEFENTQDKRSFLSSYVDTYLKEEVLEEGLTRNLYSFKNFLKIAAANNGEMLSYNNIAQDTGISSRNIKSHYEILEDTLIGFKLYPYKKSIRKKQREKPKFYFFDTGVVRALQGLSSIELHPKTAEYGHFFEHFIINEIIKANSYRKTDYQFSYLSTPHSEIDLIIEKPSGEVILLEIKSTDNVRPKHYKTLELLGGDIANSKSIVVSRDKYRRKTDSGVLICPWKKIIEEVFGK